MTWGRNSVGRRASDRKKPEDSRAEIAVPLSVFIEERLEAGVAGAADGQAVPSINIASRLSLP